jgi:hypothetical protein
MAIEVKRIKLPVVTLEGLTISGGLLSGSASTVVVNKENIRKRTAGGIEWEHRATRIFYNEVRIIDVDTGFPIYSEYQETGRYGGSPRTEFKTLRDNPNVKTFQGSELVNPGDGMLTGRNNRVDVGRMAEVYYSLNGEDPLRSKTYLWTGKTVTIRHNPTGAGNCTIKFKTLYQGKTSYTLTIKLQIARAEKTIV